MKFKFTYLTQYINNILHFSNLTFFIYGTFNYKYFSEEKKKKFFNLSLKNGSILFVDAINHSNVNKFFYLIPSIMAKLFILGYYYKLFGFQIKEEISDFLNMKCINIPRGSLNAKNKKEANNFQELINEELDEKDQIELAIADDKITRITRLFELTRKIKFSDKKSDEFAKFLDKYDSEHRLMLNGAVILTLLSPFI